MRFRFWFLLPFLFVSCSTPAIFTAPAPEAGALAPMFTLETPEGESVSLSDFRGQVVLMNFWATWCAPCRVEMPIIQSRYDQGGFAVLMIDFDESGVVVRAFMDDIGLDLPVLLDPGGIVREQYRVRGLPSSFLVDRDGVIRFLHVGEMTENELDGYLTQLGVMN